MSVVVEHREDVVYGRHIDNVQAALDWAFSPSGDWSIGVALTISALPLWFHQSLLLECRGRVERALASLAERPGRDRRRQMQLQTALLVALMHTRGTTPDTAAVWTTILHIRRPCRHRVSAGSPLGLVASPHHPR
jgi:hypothetical protein